MVKYPLKCSDILTSYSFTISTLIRLQKNCTSLGSDCTEDKYMLLQELFCDSSIAILLTIL